MKFIGLIYNKRNNKMSLGIVKKIKRHSRFCKYINSKRKTKNSSGDEIANVNFYAVRPEATRVSVRVVS